MRDALAAAEEYFRGSGAEVQWDPHVQETLGGEQVVHGQQQHRGLSLFPHAVLVAVDADGNVTSEGNPLIDVTGAEVVPSLPVEEAVRIAFRHLRQGSNDACHADHAPLFAGRRYRPRVVSAFPMPNRPTVLSKGPFHEPVQANLVLFSETKALAWLVSLAVARVADFTIVVSDGGDILYCTAEAASACRGNVYRFNPDEAAAVEVDFLDDWMDNDATHGNNVRTQFNSKNRLVSATGGRFVFAAGSADEQLVNAFYLCNFLHDLFARFGFGEADGNFQQKNFSGLGKAGDRLIVNVLTSAHGNANMRAQNDGVPAELTLGVWRNGNPSALDADVVIHEFAHGVSQRLVGGRLKKSALAERQALAMGEGWSDYFALTIQNFHRAQPRYTFASYASRKPLGERPAPYDNFTAHFGDLGTPPFDEQHGAGSVFAAALLAMQDELRALLGHEAGHETGWQLVVASLKKVIGKKKPSPTFLDGRDAILRCIPGLASPRAAEIEAAVRTAFARFGMGRHAACNDTSFKNIREDFTP